MKQNSLPPYDDAENAALPQLTEAFQSAIVDSRHTAATRTTGTILKHPPPPLYDGAEDGASAALSQLAEAVPSAIVDSQHTTAARTTEPTLSALRKGAPKKGGEGDTVFYLAYGSNMSAATFRGRRGIRPISTTNVIVPGLRLTFGLPGIAYLEPCFANVHLSSPDAGDNDADDDNDNDDDDDDDDDNDGWWTGGLVGVVYEVTREDYGRIIATEGGGAGYQVVYVRAFPLPLDDATGGASREAILACTLCAPAKMERGHRAQPSERYLQLLRTGAREHGLPAAYQDWLARLQPYRAAAVGQKVGGAIWAVAWMPMMMLAVTLTSALADAQGQSPAWVRWLQLYILRAQWLVYDYGFGRVFGDGEHTVAGTPEKGAVAAREKEREELLGGSVL